MTTNTQLAHTLRENARRLELQVATTRLLTHLFHQESGTAKTEGRYRFLEELIEQHPTLLQALLNRQDATIQSEWSQVQQQHLSDVLFLHTLAVAYHECALASRAKQQDSEQARYWVLSTTLWVLLLSSTAFWDYFAEARNTTDKGERLPLGMKEQENLLHSSLGDILALHSRYGSQHFAEGHYEQAKDHLRCLDFCRSGEQALRATLKEYGLTWQLKLDKGRLQWLTERARKLLDDWCATLIAEAEKATKDAEAIKRLPQGIRMNYQGGIRQLEPFIKLNIPVVRLLSTCLDWYNDWCYDLYVTKDKKRIKELMQPAGIIAEQLKPRSTKAHEHKQENQVLSQYYLLRGFTTDDPKLAIQEYEEALAWNSTNSNAKKLLEDEHLSLAIECVERKQFQEAYQILEAVEQKAIDKAKVRQARAAVCFRHANALAEDGKFSEALVRAREARRLDPNESVFPEFITMLEKLGSEGDNLRHMKNAKEAYENDRYDEAIASASQVSSRSQFYSQARHLLSAAYFNRGIKAANSYSFHQAKDDLERALALNTDRQERKHIESQLAVLREISKRLYGY